MQAGETVTGPAQPEVVQWTGIRIHKYVDTEPAGLVVHVVSPPDEAGRSQPVPDDRDELPASPASSAAI